MPGTTVVGLEKRPCHRVTVKFFTVLLLASLSSTCLSVLDGPKDEIHLEAQPTDTRGQVLSKNDQVSREGLSKESAISREEPVSEEEVVIESIERPKNQTPELLHPIPRRIVFRNAAFQLEEMTELTPGASTTSEEKLAKLGHKIGKNLDKTVKETVNYLKSLFPRASEVKKP
ncbi:LOW QUALITY PROTEIN: glycosylation-dependent cell adhesion molecule 1-like [Rhinolophus ferrumequinum]|uniref:LOW QUALITY PROTEIN: glycosylation-dependent cell adhesion molecule 1-like n=1 Tax=Rhinolophus ferrumequinum TaxID=59479 RepID=UPI00140F618D|nr:LOW QUALITY PROTEIN: glycosylation-dependent cell adhesion molecule 1-like [Rhinolophus ferrumequinum]